MNWYIVERIHTINAECVVRFVIDGVQAESDSVAMACAVRRNGWKSNEVLRVTECFTQYQRSTAVVMNRHRTAELQELLELMEVS